MSTATETQKVITFKNVAQRAVRIPPTDYFEWLKPRLEQATVGKDKHKLRKITPEDCVYAISKDEDLGPRFGEQEAGVTHKLEVVESEVGINSQELTAQGRMLRRPEYHMDQLDRFQDREGSYISILNECLQQTKNPNISIKPDLNQSTTPPTFRCSPEGNGNIVALVSGNAPNKTEAKSYIAKFLLRELFPMKESMEKGYNFRDHSLPSKEPSVLPIRDKIQAALNPKPSQQAATAPSIGSMLLDKKASEHEPGLCLVGMPICSLPSEAIYAKLKTPEAEKSQKEMEADARAILEQIQNNRGGVALASHIPGLDDSELSEVSNDKTYLLNQSGFEYQRIHEQGNAHIPRAEAEDMLMSKWPGIPLNTLVATHSVYHRWVLPHTQLLLRHNPLVTNLELLETFKKDFLGKRESFLRVADLKKPNKHVETTKLLKSVLPGKYSFVSTAEQQQLFQLLVKSSDDTQQPVFSFAETIHSNIGKDSVIDHIIACFQRVDG